MIIVETGAGVVGANSYASREDADNYHAARLNVDWTTAADERKAPALIRATDYIEQRYRAPARRYAPQQGLQWPVEGDSGLPAAIVQATIALALHALNAPLSGPATRSVKVEKTYSNGKGFEQTFDDDQPADPYPHVTAILRDVAQPVGEMGVVRMLRLG